MGVGESGAGVDGRVGAYIWGKVKATSLVNVLQGGHRRFRDGRRDVNRLQHRKRRFGGCLRRHAKRRSPSGNGILQEEARK